MERLTVQGYNPLCGDTWWHNIGAAGHIVSLSGNRIKECMWLLRPLSPFYSIKTEAHGTVLPTFKVGLPTPCNLI